MWKTLHKKPSAAFPHGFGMVSKHLPSNPAKNRPACKPKKIMRILCADYARNMRGMSAIISTSTDCGKRNDISSFSAESPSKSLIFLTRKCMALICTAAAV